MSRPRKFRSFVCHSTALVMTPMADEPSASVITQTTHASFLVLENGMGSHVLASLRCTF